MCLILLAFQAHETYPLILAANRDEFYQRPTRSARWWEDFPEILAGKDLQAGGTWLGLNSLGEFSAITNYREVQNIKENAPSRGKLVLDYLKENVDPKVYLEGVAKIGQRYNGFNLFCGNINELVYYGNRGDKVQVLTPGVYGLSNHLLDTPWPKVLKGKEYLSNWIQKGQFDLDTIFAYLADSDRADDETLPDTGVGKELERNLSPLFIDIPNYGTRVSSIILMDNIGNVQFVERNWKEGSVHRFEYNALVGNPNS